MEKIIKFEHHKTELPDYDTEQNIIGHRYIYCIEVKKIDKIVDDLNIVLNSLIDITHCGNGEDMWCLAKETAEKINGKSIEELEDL